MTLPTVVIEYAIRYCVSRNSYALDDGLDLAAEHWDDLSDSTKHAVILAITDRERCDPLSMRVQRVKAAWAKGVAS